MLKVYLSHNYAARDYLAEIIVPFLKSHGVEVISRWLHSSDSDSCADSATVDLQDVRSADAVIHFTDNFGERVGKGKYVELGLAYAMGRKVILVGNRNGCVFYHLPGVVHCNLIEEAVSHLVC